VKFFQICFLPALLVALAAGCRKNIPEPPDWNLEKHLGQRGKPAGRGNVADVPQEMPSVFLEHPVEPLVPQPAAQQTQPADPDAQPVAQDEQPVAQPAVLEEPTTPQPPAGRRPPRYNVPRSSRRLVVPVDDGEVEPGPETE